MPERSGDSRDDDVQGEIPSQSLREFESLVASLSQPKHVFRLYVAGNSSRSRQAITNVREICERYLGGNYELDIVDVYQEPESTKTADIIALPTLIKELPSPQKKFVGDMSDTNRIVVGLKLKS